MAEAEIVEADLHNAQHQDAILRLLDEYSQEPIISGKPLAASVRSELLAGLQRHPTTEVLLAYVDDQAVGIAICFMGFSTFAAKPLLNLHDLAVAADFRGQGIGRRLLEAVEQKAKQLACCKVTLEVHEDNAAARSAYQAAGFRPRADDSNERQSLFLSKNFSQAD